MVFAIARSVLACNDVEPDSPRSSGTQFALRRFSCSSATVACRFNVVSSKEISMVTLNINGKEEELDVLPAMPLLWALRDVANLTGTKYGCGMSLCGACTVHVDGKAIRSCVTPVSTAVGKKIVTIEGLAADSVGKAVQEAWQKLDVVQCGYCQSGQIMSAAALLRGNKKPSDADIDSAMSGNICRCATYVRIRAAIHEAANTLA
jgi:isoquinoline 1-oxidoreductase subunit alpha